MKSLFVGSVPRSFSSATTDFIHQSLDLQKPVWTTDGEILNADRMTLSRGVGSAGNRFVQSSGVTSDPLSEPDRTFGNHHDRVFQRLLRFLNEVTELDGYLYKDVLQPFVVSEFLQTTPIKSLYLHRPLADVVYRMDQKEWYFPVPEPDQPDLEALIRGIHRAQTTLRESANTELDFDLLIEDFQPLKETLEALYPGSNPRCPTYREGTYPYHDDPEFIDQRDHCLAIRETRRYQRIEQRIEKAMG